MPNFDISEQETITASILLVDDRPANLFALEALLAPLGHRLVRASSGKQAVEYESREDFALILLDVQMPDLDGFETAALIRRQGRRKNTPIVFLTAVYADESRPFRAYEYGAVDYLTKPFDANALRAKVNVFVDLYVQRKRLERVTETLRARERFIGILSHDLRSPLGSIVVGASMLAGRTDLPEASLTIARRIARNSERMARMIQDLLDFTQSRSGGGIPASPRPIELAAVCNRVLTEELEVTHPSRDVRLSVEGDSKGMWDPDRVEQVVTNLTTNALEHGPQDAPVNIRIRDEGAAVSLEVHNEGPPISEELLPSLFDPFRRVANPNAGARPKGVGLGLYIVEQIARAHGGNVSVSSTADAGTTFRVIWPRRAPTLSP